MHVQVNVIKRLALAPALAHGIVISSFSYLVIMKKITIISGLILIVLLSGCSVGSKSEITSFDDCVKAGNPVMESYPRQCAEPGGKTFTEVITKSEPVDGVCENKCGDGQCQEIVCMAVGCPCGEAPDTCPDDCK